MIDCVSVPPTPPNPIPHIYTTSDPFNGRAIKNRGMDTPPGRCAHNQLYQPSPGCKHIPQTVWHAVAGLLHEFQTEAEQKVPRTIGRFLGQLPHGTYVDCVGLCCAAGSGARRSRHFMHKIISEMHLQPVVQRAYRVTVACKIPARDGFDHSIVHYALLHTLDATHA